MWSFAVKQWMEITLWGLLLPLLCEYTSEPGLFPFCSSKEVKLFLLIKPKSFFCSASWISEAYSLLSPPLKVAHEGQVWTCLQNWKGSLAFKGTHESSQIKNHHYFFFNTPFPTQRGKPFVKSLLMWNVLLCFPTHKTRETPLRRHMAWCPGMPDPRFCIHAKRRLPTPWYGLSQQSEEGALQISSVFVQSRAEQTRKGGWGDNFTHKRCYS